MKKLLFSSLIALFFIACTSTPKQETATEEAAMEAPTTEAVVEETPDSIAEEAPDSLMEEAADSLAEEASM